MPLEPPEKLYGVERETATPGLWTYKVWNYGEILVRKNNESDVEAFTVKVSIGRNLGSHRPETTTWMCAPHQSTLNLTLESAVEVLRDALRLEYTSVSRLAESSRRRAFNLDFHLRQLNGSTGENNPTLWDRLDDLSG